MFSSNASQVSAANYIEDVFSTYLYTGTGSAQTITNGVDLSTKGGMVWLKDRSVANPAWIMDTTRGTSSTLQPSSTNAAGSISTAITAFNTTGFTIGTNLNSNTNGNNYVSWTFREQAKFFDVVTYTGTGANRTIAHNLGSVPGCIMIKRTNATAAWAVYHRSLANTQYMVLNTTAAAATGATYWNSTTPTSSVFSLGTSTDVNASGGTYVAYIFAHDAGGFGASGADNVISCGSYTGNGSASGPTVTLGYEPQFIMIKNITGTGNWQIIDNMRGMPVVSADATLQANASNAETSVDYLTPSATGFQITSTSTEVNTSASTYIYIAIRRGPMKTPSVGTSVYSPVAYTGGTINRLLSYGFPIDLWIDAARTGTSLAGYEWPTFTRLLSVDNALETTSTDSWGGGWGNNYLRIDNNSGVYLTTNTGYLNASTGTFIGWGFGRAPGFFDVVCYTGTGSATTVSHNLGVAPELMIIKSRSTVVNWYVYSLPTGNGNALILNNTQASTAGATVWNNTSPTSSVFSLGTATGVNGSGTTYVAYLFATLAGVSKVGSYTGTAALQTIGCGFTSGARFVLIKRTDSTGDWYVWDSARGITSGNDPYILLNSTASEVTGTNYVDTDTTGFKVTAAAPVGLNASGGTYIFLAIA